MTPPIIEVREMSKKYRLGQIGFGTLREDITNAWHRLRTGKDHVDANRSGQEEFWALRDISFDVQQGEILGVIGRNGAGKSTLLKILSRITEPTSGEAILRGRVASLLEVGTGFNPELTGRENVYMNGTILGMKKREITAKLDEIIGFAEIEQHIDTPVKRYSSGMYVRLAFAVAAHLEPEILIVDEVLAVGDVEFQKKCLGKMKEVTQKGGRTVLFVSHNLSAVSSLCGKCVMLDKGRLACFSDTASCLDLYSSSMHRQDAAEGVVDCEGNGFRSVSVVTTGEEEEKKVSVVNSTERAEIVMECRFPKSVSLNLGFTVFNKRDVGIMGATALDSCAELPVGVCRIRIPLPLTRLPTGEYRIQGVIWDAATRYAESEHLATFSVINTLFNRAGVEQQAGTLLDERWAVEK